MKSQIEIISIEQLIAKDHTYRKYKELLDFSKIIKSVNYKKAETEAVGYGFARLLKCLILQFAEDLSGAC